MKKKYSIILILIIICISHLELLLSQETDSTDKKAPFHFNKHSVQFRFVYNFSLSDFQGSLLSYKYHFYDKIALRFGIGLGLQDLSTTEEKTNLSGDSSYITIESEGGRNGIDIISQIVYYFTPEKEIKLYAGLGPCYSYLEVKEDISKIDTINIVYASIHEISSRKYDYGLSMIYGVEWFFRKNMSLLGEYGFRFYYRELRYEEKGFTYYPDQPDRFYIDNIESNGWILSSEAVKFGLSIYF